MVKTTSPISYTFTACSHKQILAHLWYCKLRQYADNIMFTIPHTNGFDLQELLKFMKLVLNVVTIYLYIRNRIYSFLMP